MRRAEEVMRDYEGATVPFDAHLARAKREDADRNQMMNRIERLPRWMREIELLFWGMASIGGGT